MMLKPTSQNSKTSFKNSWLKSEHKKMSTEICQLHSSVKNYRIITKINRHPLYDAWNLHTKYEKHPSTLGCRVSAQYHDSVRNYAIITNINKHPLSDARNLHTKNEKQTLRTVGSRVAQENVNRKMSTS